MTADDIWMLIDTKISPNFCEKKKRSKKKKQKPSLLLLHKVVNVLYATKIIVWSQC